MPFKKKIIVDFNLKRQGNIAKKLKNVGKNILIFFFFLHLVICYYVYLVLLIVASLFKQIISIGIICLQRMKRTEGTRGMKGGKIFECACDDIFGKGRNSMRDL